jgi:hypothetical protein
LASDAAVSAAAVVDSYLADLHGETRRLAPTEWGLTVEAGGWPLHVGVAVRDARLRAQGEVLAPGRVDPHALLHWNRSLPLVRFSHTAAGEVWVQGDLPLAAVTDEQLDALLGLLVRVAAQARESVASAEAQAAARARSR